MWNFIYSFVFKIDIILLNGLELLTPQKSNYFGAHTEAHTHTQTGFTRPMHGAHKNHFILNNRA